MSDIQSIAKNKIISVGEAHKIRLNWNNENKKIVFTNGVFDLLHAGHVQSLMTARGYGDVLCVGLNADSSVKRLKGENRPIVDEDARALLLASLFFVDAVVLFEEDTPLNLIKILLPDVLVKSADYNIQNIIGAKEVIDAGGLVQITPILPGLSTTAIVEKIKAQTIY